MSIKRKVRVFTGTISSVDIENGQVGLNDASGRVKNVDIMPSNLYDTDGNRIFIEELKVGDQVVINETGYVMIMRVFQTA